MKHILITTIAAALLVGCGPSATDTGKTDVQSTSEKQEAELATFLPGKRIYFRIPIPGDPGDPTEPAEPEPKLFSDEPEVEPGKKPTPPEIVWQFEKDGTIAMGVFLDGEVEFFDDEEMSYKMNGLEVVGFEDGKEEGGMTFSSANPKKGDKVLMGEKGQEKVPVTITRIEDASSPPPVSKTPSQPPVSPAKPEPVAETPAPERQARKVPDIIYRAAAGGNIEGVKQHLAAGKDVNAKDAFGRTPLHLAASWGHKEVAELLIDNGADVNAKDDGPLSRAALRGHKEIVELLIAKGADVNAKNNKGKTPLDQAIKRKHTETAALLRKHGAKKASEL